MTSDRNITYDRENSCRLDKYLGELKIPELYSRSLIEKIIADALVKVNSVPVKKSYLLKQGDTISISIPEPDPADIIPQDIPLNIVYEDDFLAVINKPAGLVVHPGFGNPDQTVANAIVHRYKDSLTGAENRSRPGIVHRLDKDTSGLMLIAKDDRTQSLLSGLFASRQVKKTYLAISTGVPEPPEERVETLISRSVSNPLKMAVSNTGRTAVTHYRVMHYYQCFTLMQIDLETGRMHQIRVHLAHRNIPVLGDRLYNSLRNVQNYVPDNLQKKVTELLANHLKRQALHAWKLQFTHPCTGQALALTAPLPDDMAYTLDWLDKYFAVDNERFDKKLLA